MEISNPRRILAVSLAESAEVLGKVIKDLTGTHPSPSSSVEAVDSLAGTTHILSLSTQYYKAEVPVWLDLVSSPSEWSESFLSEEAREVLSVLGGLIIVFSLPPTNPSSSSSTAETRELISQVGRVVKEGLGGWDWDGVSLAICISDHHHVDEEEGGLDEWDDLCAAAGLEFVHHSTSTTTTTKNAGDKKNEFGEKMGMQRVIEALQANDWSAPDGDLDDDDSDDSEGEHRKGGPGKGDWDPESLSFGFDRADFEGLRKAIWSSGVNDEEVEVFMNMNMGSSGSIGGPATETREGGAGKSRGGRQAGDLKVDVSDDDELNGLGGDEDIQKIEGMMLKLQAVRDMSAGMPDEQRKRMAKQAVDEVMKEL
ncbi:alpha and gamma adaptin binding protein p34 [Diplogelasinospora grovesii]|uniref:Alpha and gamma adaptin binding protein p34 n=1 Tax=Diplogelasinospora grovesii TaxID=303347 RepID=A0AAN6S987_9PEZI|nr:alpha and gamma adaptin binding protein p34 [Diplogelasinospora grovesii]